MSIINNQPDASFDSPLRELFGCEVTSGPLVEKRFRFLNRNGRMLLALPISNSEAVAAIRLYAPQRAAARIASRILRLLLRAGFPLPLRTTALQIPAEDPLSLFLGTLSARWGDRDNGLGILAGNPNANGRRFVMLLLEAGRSIAVVKAGIGEAAQNLVAAEADFLSANAPVGVARPIAVLKSARVHAFAMLPLAGEAPHGASAGDIHRVLAPWIGTSERRLSELAVWEKVRAESGDSPIWVAHCKGAESNLVRPSVVHGDFAPWNIKVNPETLAWQVYDWERGENCGLPGWDWIHFVVQHAVLVNRESAREVVSRIDGLFTSPEFRDYAKKASIEGSERAILCAYLLHCVNSGQQTEGLETLKAVLESQARPLTS